MALKSLNCPNCWGIFDPSNNCCDHCGSYLIYVDENEKYPKDFEKSMFKEKNKAYVCNIQLNNNEYPIRVCTGAYIKSIWTNISGWLVLTNMRFLLIGFKHNIILDIPIFNISTVKSGVFGISGNLRFIANNKKYNFNTFGYREWKEKIINLRK